MQRKQYFRNCIVGATAVIFTIGLVDNAKHFETPNSRRQTKPAYKNNQKTRNTGLSKLQTHQNKTPFTTSSSTTSSSTTISNTIIQNNRSKIVSDTLKKVKSYTDLIDKIQLDGIKVLATDDSTTRKNVPSKQCQRITKEGHWENWEEHRYGVPQDNFSIFSHDMEGMRYHDNVWAKDYQFSWPPWQHWGDQNYKGSWTGFKNSDDEKKSCKLHKFSGPELQECFNYGKDVVQIIGDSVGRQLWRSLIMKTQGDSTFDDTQLYKTSLRRTKFLDAEPGISKESSFLHFFWSQSFENQSCKKCPCGQCVAALDETLVNAYNYTKVFWKIRGLQTKLVHVR